MQTDSSPNQSSDNDNGGAFLMRIKLPKREANCLPPLVSQFTDYYN